MLTPRIWISLTIKENKIVGVGNRGYIGVHDCTIGVQSVDKVPWASEGYIFTKPTIWNRLTIKENKIVGVSVEGT